MKGGRLRLGEAILQLLGGRDEIYSLLVVIGGKKRL